MFLFFQYKFLVSNLIVIVEGLGEQAASLSKKEDRIQADIEYKLRRFLSSWMKYQKVEKTIPHV